MKNPSVPSWNGDSRHPCPRGRPSGRASGSARQPGWRARNAAIRLGPFLVEQRAGDVDQPPAGLAPASPPMIEQARLRSGEARRARRASAASAPRDCAARCRCPSTAHRPAPHRPCRPGRRAPPVSRPGLSRRVSIMPAPARAARGASRDRRVRSVSAAISVPRLSIAAASASVLPPAPGAQVDHGLARRRADRQAGELRCRCPALRSGRRDRRPTARPACPAAAAGRAARRSAPPSTGSASVARSALSVLTRRSSGARSSSAAASLAGDVRGRERARPASRARRRPARPARPRRSAPGRAPNRRTARASAGSPSASRSIAARPLARDRAARADRGVDQLAHRAPVLRSGEAAGAEPFGDDAVGRRAVALRRGDHRVEQLDRRLDPRGRGHRAYHRGGVVRRLAGDRDVVDVAFGQARVGDADEPRALAQVLDASRAPV